MQSAGNDIIDLGTINQKRSRDRRFYSKFLSNSEQLLYQRQEYIHLPWEQYVWLLWSIKESAYKYLKRGLPELIFSPPKMIIRDLALPADPETHIFTEKEWEGNAAEENCYKGSLLYENTVLYFKSKIYSELIATVVSEDETFKDIWWGIQTIEYTGIANQSKAVRSFLLTKLSCLLPGNRLRITEPSGGYPRVLELSKECMLPVSFAHHDRFIAYSFLLHTATL